MAIQYTDNLDRTFHALGDASRRHMLSVLAARGACTAGELGELFDSAQPTISKHLRVLEEAQLVMRRVEGRRHLFSLTPARLHEARSWMDRHLAFWEGSLDQLAKLLDDLRYDASKDDV